MSIDKVKVLIVEDEELDSENIARSLEALGFAVNKAVKGKEAEAALKGFDGFVLKRVSASEETQSAGCLELYPAHYEVKKNGRDIQLTLREYKLLSHLIRGKGRIFSREELLSDVWDYDYIGDVRTVDVMIRRIREKLEDDPSRPVFVKTKRSVGYYFDMNACR